MSFNNAPLIKALDQETTTVQDSLPAPPVRTRVESGLCLPERLPNTSTLYRSCMSSLVLTYPGFIHREAESLAPVALRKELARNDPGPKEPEEEVDEIPALPVQEQQTDEQSEEEPPKSPTSSLFKSIAKTITGFSASTPRQRPQPVSWSNVQVCLQSRV